MKKYSSLFGIFLFPVFLFCQKNSLPQLLELKMTPTSIMNLTKPNLLVGAEFYISPKIGLQLEYGLQLFTRHPSDVSRLMGSPGKGHWHYQRIKGELKYYTYFKKGFADYYSIGVLHTPQSYSISSRPITLMDGQRISIPNARMDSNAMAVFLNYGGKI